MNVSWAPARGPVVIGLLLAAFALEVVLTYPRLVDSGPRTAAHRNAAVREREIDDTSATRDAAFVYGPGWQRVRGMHDGRSLGTSTRSMRPGAIASLTFVGTGVTLDGIVGPTGGHARVTVDGAALGTIVSFAEPVKRVGAVFSAHDLGDGPHRITIVVEPPEGGRPSQRFVNIDGARYERKTDAR